MTQIFTKNTKGFKEWQVLERQSQSLRNPQNKQQLKGAAVKAWKKMGRKGQCKNLLPSLDAVIAIKGYARIIYFIVSLFDPVFCLPQIVEISLQIMRPSKLRVAFRWAADLPFQIPSLILNSNVFSIKHEGIYLGVPILLERRVIWTSKNNINKGFQTPRQVYPRRFLFHFLLLPFTGLFYIRASPKFNNWAKDFMTKKYFSHKAINLCVFVQLYLWEETENILCYWVWPRCVVLISTAHLWVMHIRPQSTPLVAWMKIWKKKCQAGEKGWKEKKKYLGLHPHSLYAHVHAHTNSTWLH